MVMMDAADFPLIEGLYVQGTDFTRTRLKCAVCKAMTYRAEVTISLAASSVSFYRTTVLILQYSCNCYLVSLTRPALRLRFGRVQKICSSRSSFRQSATALVCTES
ncbi:hypothetical protein SRHO_G00041650 [Serrasalmus rhombeus]